MTPASRATASGHRRPRSSRRCRRWRCAPSRSTSGRASPTSTARRRSSPGRSRRWRPGATSTPPAPAYPSCGRRSSRHQQRHYGLELDPDDQVVVTTGCTEAIAAALLGLVDPGDEVVVLEPYYDSYVAMIQMAGGVRRPVTLRAPDFRLDLDELRAAVTPATRFVLLNSPHNPTGTVLTRRGAARRRRGGGRARPRGHHRRGLRAPASTTSSTCRSRPCPAWRSARSPCPAPASPTRSPAGRSAGPPGPPTWCGAVLAAKQWLTFTSAAPLQPAVAHALDELPDWPAELARDLRVRRDLLCDGLAAVDGIDVVVPDGTYFATTDVSALGWDDGDGVLPGAARARRRRRHPEPGLPRRPAGTGPAPGPLGLLQDARADQRGDRAPGRADLRA